MTLIKKLLEISNQTGQMIQLSSADKNNNKWPLIALAECP